VFDTFVIDIIVLLPTRHVRNTVSANGQTLSASQCLSRSYGQLHTANKAIDSHWRIQNFNLGGGAHGERGTRAYNGGLEAEPTAGFRGRAPGQGVRGRSPPKAESILALGHPTDTANLHPWPVAVFSV